MLNEVAPPGWGHTKAEKEKTKPNKPKSKIGGTAAAFKRALDDGRFKGLPGSKTKKEKTADMFKLMWSMKKKGDKPHYKPGTDKKFKKYQESVENGKVDLTLKAGVNNVLKQDNREYDRGLLTQVNKDGSYDVAYWYDKYKAYPVEVEIDGKTCAKDAKNIHIKFHPELKKEDWKPEIEHIKGSDLRKKAAEKKRKEAADSLPPHLRLDAMKKAFKHTNEGVTYGYKGKKYKKLPAGVKTSSGWGTDARDEFGKLKDAITDKLGKTNTKRDGVLAKEDTSMPNIEKKDRSAIKKRFKGLFKKDIKGTVPGVNEGNLHNKMDTFKSKAVKRRDQNSLGTIASATKRYELLKKLIGSKKKHDKPAIKK